MSIKTIVFVFGTRPEFIKMFPIIRESRRNKNVRTVACSTGQHREMLQSLYQLFDFQPDIDFKLMKPNQTLAYMHTETMGCMNTVIDELKPDWVVVQGDTTSAHAAAMAAFYLKIPVAHVEAGLRTYNIHSPFPEELNRRTIGLVAQAHLCPTAEACHNLQREHIDKLSFIAITGNTGLDTLKIISEKIADSVSLKALYSRQFSYLSGEKFILATLHRRENFGEPLREVLRAFLEIVRSRRINILFPIHPNPNIRAAIDEAYKDEMGHLVQTLSADAAALPQSKSGRIFLVEPLEYPALMYAMKQCQFLMTDSGGLQEEAPSFSKKILVLRKSTERPEGVSAGFSQLVGTDFSKIVRESQKLIDSDDHWGGPAPANPYGDSLASARILKILTRDRVPEPTLTV